MKQSQLKHGELIDYDYNYRYSAEQIIGPPDSYPEQGPKNWSPEKTGGNEFVKV